MTVLLVLACALMIAGWLVQRAGRLDWAGWLQVAYLAALFAWFAGASGLFGLRGGEEGLMRWTGWALGVSLLGALARRWWRAPGWLPEAAFLLAAALYAMSFDPLRPNAYALVPSLLLGAMVLLVAGRVIVRFGRGLDGRRRLALWVGTLATAGLVYASGTKLMDRGWALPEAYAAAGGGLLYALAAIAWVRERLAGEAGGAWRVAADLATLLLVAGAFFHYRQFL